MNLRQICLVVLVLGLGLAAFVVPVLASDSQSSEQRKESKSGSTKGEAKKASQKMPLNPLKKAKLVALLDAEVKKCLDGNPQHILIYYQSVKKALAANSDRPEWKMFPSMPAFSEPILVAQFAELSLNGKPLPLSQATRDYVKANRHQALNFAIELTQAEFSATARMAADLIKQYRDDLTAQHWEKILQGRQYIVRHRAQYPAGLNTWAEGFSHIPFGYVFIKNIEARCLDARTTYYVDGIQKYPNTTHGLGWRSDLGYVGFEKLSVGPHNIQFKTKYKFKLGDVELTGTNQSAEIEIEIMPAGSPDKLAATADENLIAEVEAAVIVGEKKDGREITYSKPASDGNYKPYAKIWVPAIKVVKPVSVSLQMKPEIYIAGEAKPLTRYVIRVPAGATTERILENAVGDSRLTRLLKEKADSAGRLKAKLVLRPSREHALADPRIKRYYPKVIEREIEFSWRSVD